MTVLTIDQAKYPDGCTATPAAGGSLTASTQYYYRIAAVTDQGETCACDAFSGTTTSPNRTLNLAWNEVAGVKATGGYKIYRNTSDSWTSGSLLLVTVDTNSFVDDGDPAPGAGLPMTFSSDLLLMMPQNIPSLLDEKTISGVEGGSIGYLGSPPETLSLTGSLKGATSKTMLDKLRAIRTGGVACQVTITAYSLTWIQADYLLRSIQWSLGAGLPDDSDAVVLHYSLDLVKVV